MYLPIVLSGGPQSGHSRRVDAEMRVALDAARQDIRLVAEGVVLHAEAITRMRAAFDDFRDR